MANNLIRLSRSDVGFNEQNNVLNVLEEGYLGIGKYVEDFEKSICKNGQMNEGKISTLYGLEGIPSLSEEITLERDLKILEYTGGKLFIPTISTSR